MPNRIIEESIRSSEQIDELSWFEEVMFYRLIVSADDYGRLDGRIALLKSVLFPIKEAVTKKAIEGAIAKLTSVGLLHSYEVNGKPYLCFPTWDEHQRIRNKHSKYPAPDANQSQKTGLTASRGQLSASRGELSSESNPIQSNPNLNIKSESESESNLLSLPRASGFVPPTVEQVAAYVAERGSRVIASEWVDYYAARDWMMGKVCMSDWKAAVRAAENWEQWSKPRRSVKGSNQPVSAAEYKAPGMPSQGDVERMKQMLARMEGENNGEKS